MGKYNFSDFDIAKRLGDTVQMLHSTYAHQFKDAGKNIINSMEGSVDEVKIPLKTIKNDDYISELKSLKELLDIGVITEEEFSLKKKQLLGI